MTVARTAAEELEGHVTLEVESIERMYLNLYEPQLQRELGVVGFFKQRGFAFASGAVMQPITTAFLTAMRAFVDDAGVDLGRHRSGLPGGLRRHRAGPVRGGGAGEGPAADHREASQPSDGCVLSVAGEVLAGGQSLLFLRHR
jgi:hypothetical protein